MFSSKNRPIFVSKSISGWLCHLGYREEWLRQGRQHHGQGCHSEHVSFGQVEDGEGADEEGGEANKVLSIRAICSWQYPGNGPGHNPGEDGIDGPIVPEIGDGILRLAFSEVNFQRLFSADMCKYS